MSASLVLRLVFAVAGVLLERRPKSLVRFFESVTYYLDDSSVNVCSLCIMF